MACCGTGINLACSWAMAKLWLRKHAAGTLWTSAISGVVLLYIGCALDPVGEPPVAENPANGSGGGPTTGAGGAVAMGAGGGTAVAASGGSNAAAGTSGISLAGGSAAVGTSTTSSSDCYSPTQNTNNAYQANAKGCPCNPATDTSVCVQGVGLICQSNFWMAVQDGPCMPAVSTTYSPAACTAAGGIAVPSPGSPISAAKDCASGVALGIIDAASSGWVEGGLCCAAPLPVGKACGGRAGNTCSATEYCAYQDGEWCGAADAQSTCKPRPTTCVEIYAPVCGCDSNTYSNSCLAAVAGTGIYAAGKCAI